MLAVAVVLTAILAAGIAAGTSVQECRPDASADAAADERVPIKCYRGGDVVEIRCPDGFVYRVAADVCAVADSGEHGG